MDAAVVRTPVPPQDNTKHPAPTTTGDSKTKHWGVTRAPVRGRGAVQWTRCRVGLNSSAADKVVLVGQSVNRSRQCSSLSSLSLVWVSKPDSGPGGQWVHSSCWSIHTYHTTPHHRQSSTPILKVPCWALGSTRGAQPRDLGHCVAIKTTAGKVSVCSRDCSHREGFLRRLKRDGAIQRSTAPQESNLGGWAVAEEEEGAVRAGPCWARR